MFTVPEWPVAMGASFIRRLVQQISERGLAKDILLNVNIPNLSEEQIKGVQVTRLGKRIYSDELVVRTDPRGNKYYWIGGSVPPTHHRQEGTDVTAVDDGYVSITPIHLDLTSLREDVWQLLRDLRF